jgi:hypothetical protein
MTMREDDSDVDRDLELFAEEVFDPDDLHAEELPAVTQLFNCKACIGTLGSLTEATASTGGTFSCGE